MTKRLETSFIVGDGVKENSQKDIYQIDTLDDFIALVTEPGREADAILVAGYLMMLDMEIDTFGDRLTTIRRQKLIELREEINSWWRVESARQIQAYHKEKAARQRADRLLKKRCKGGKR